MTVCVEGGAVLHEYPANDVRAVQPYFDIILIVQAHVSEYGDDSADHIGVGTVLLRIQHVQEDVNQVQVPHLDEHVVVVSGPSHGRERLEAAEDGLAHLVALRGGQLADELLAGAELLEEPLHLLVAGEHVQGA